MRSLGEQPIKIGLRFGTWLFFALLAFYLASKVILNLPIEGIPPAFVSIEVFVFILATGAALLVLNKTYDAS